MEPLTFFKCLADDTRLKTVLLIQAEGELCVCELTTALETSQPKVSRHLAQLRDSELLSARREGQWVYYAISSSLPQWACSVITATASGHAACVERCHERLQSMGDRPERAVKLCGIRT